MINELNGHNFIKQMKEKKERKKRKNPMEIFEKKSKSKQSNGKAKETYGDKTRKYSKK
jgi:hypothetical protein